MEKMKRWFSEYNYLLPHLSRRTNWSSWFKAKWSNKLLWLIYLTMKDFLFVYLKLELLLLKIGLYVPPTQWNITKTTKKSNNLLP
jgi:hypothetical protein